MTIRALVLKTAACLFCALLLLIRMRITGSYYFSFIVWNLFLAAMPLGFAILLPRSRHFSHSLPLLAMWLLFFPNAPYVLTDLIHLQPRAAIPLWFDLLMLLSFALTALGFGFQSLHLVQQWIAEQTSALTGWLAVLVIMPLTGFGIYLGRFLRWNSWDIIKRPFSLFGDIFVLVRHPLAHLHTWGFTIGFAVMLLIAYLAWMQSPNAKSSPS